MVMRELQSMCCLRLCSAVFTQAICDAETGSEVERDAALEWIFNGSHEAKNSFESACSWLDIDPGNARQLLLKRRFRLGFERWSSAVSEHLAKKAA